MRIMLAPDSFKGSLTAVEVVEIMQAAVLKVEPGATFEKLPLSDGGEGTVEALVTATQGQIIPVKVQDPLGRACQSFFGILGNSNTAVIEMAAASGIMLVTEAEKDPLRATTYGTGQLIKAALDHGCDHLLIGVGGSATNDGGVGMARALGAKFLDAQGHELEAGGAALLNLAKIELSGLDQRLAHVVVDVACDVDNPLCGPQGASAVYGPQKGASPEDIKLLDQALANYARVLSKTLDINIKDVPGAGAAGGLGGGLMAFLHGRLQSGIEIILMETKFSQRVQQCDLVFTGEGRIDGQTAFGKAPVGVAQEAKKYQLPVIAFAGSLGSGYEKVHEKGIDAVLANVQEITDLPTAIANAQSWLARSVEEAMRLIKVGQKLS